MSIIVPVTGISKPQINNVGKVLSYKVKELCIPSSRMDQIPNTFCYTDIQVCWIITQFYQRINTRKLVLPTEKSNIHFLRIQEKGTQSPFPNGKSGPFYGHGKCWVGLAKWENGGPHWDFMGGFGHGNKPGPREDLFTGWVGPKTSPW